MKRSIVCGMALLLLLLLVGCNNTGEYTPAMTLSDGMPPTKAESDGMKNTFIAKLYFVSADGALIEEERVIDLPASSSRVEAALNKLIGGPQSRSLQRSIPVDVELSRIELSNDACNVYLSGSSIPAGRAWLIARAAIAATVYAVEGIGTVNVYYNEMEPGYQDRPLGAQAPIAVALDVYLSSIQQEFQNNEETEAPSYESRTATLYYFADTTNTLLLARNTSIRYEQKAGKGEIAALLIAKLLEGDSGEQSLEPVLPYDLTLLKTPEVVVVTKETLGTWPYLNTRQNIMELYIAEPDENITYDENMLCGAITLTLTGYIPNLDGVRITMERRDGHVVTLGGTADGILTRAMYADRIGYNVYLAYPDAEGTVLYRVRKAVPCVDAYDPYVRLSAFLSGPADPGVMFPLFTSADIVDIYVVGETAVLNWKKGFSRKLRRLIAVDELSVIPVSRIETFFIYCVINTLTELPGVQRVWMLEDGEKLGTIGALYLGNALMRNPGMMVDR